MYYTIKSEDPLVIKVGDSEVEISKEDLITKIKTENYRLKEALDIDDSDPAETDIVDDKSNKNLADKLNDQASKKRQESLKRIDPQESSEVINFFQYLYSAFSMETSVEVDGNGKVILTNGQLSTDPNDARIDNIIGLYKYYNGTLDYHTLHTKLNKLRLAFLTIDNKETLYRTVSNVLGISEE